MENTISELAKERNMTTEQFLAVFAMSTDNNFKIIKAVMNQYETRISALEAEIRTLKGR